MFWILLPLLALNTAHSISESEAQKLNLRIDKMDAEFEQLKANYGNPVILKAENDIGLGFTADFLYWQAKEDGLNYTLRDTISNLAHGDTGTSGGAIKEAGGAWNPGFRLGIAYAPSWDLTGKWTYFHSNFHRKKVAAREDVAQGLGFEATWVPPMISLQADYEVVRFTWRLHFDNYDGEFGKHYFVSPKLSFRPFIAVRYAVIHQHFHVSYGPQYGPPTFPEIDVSYKNNFQGLGPRIGVDSNWELGKGFNLLLNANAALLYSWFNLHYQVSPYIDPADKGGDPIGQPIAYHTREYLRMLTPNADLVVGFGWGRSFRSERYWFGFKAAYEIQYWWDQFQRRLFVDINNNSTIKMPGDLALHGLTFDVLFEF